VISASFNPNGTLLTANGLFQRLSLDSYVSLFTSAQHPYGAWFVNTLVIGLVTAAGTVFLGALAAYSFSRMRFTGRRVGLTTLLVVQMFPQLLAVVAIFLLMVAIGDIFPAIGLNSQIGLIMVYLGGALGVNTYLMYGFFNTVPSSIDEAAKIDGAGHARIFFTIILRLVAPILAVVGLLSFIGTSSEFVLASVILIDPDKQTLAVGLYKFISDEFSKNWSVFAAGAVLAAILPVALFLALQRYIVGGLTAGSVK
ncbi:MAG TPA: sugar ABC transporter permease, partial [Microbacterium sp.]|nr:sugar ABC transporter permease [Microbacterium sp.]